ncbi:membrane integrity-associated transporter subunit PqiC [Pseudomonas lalucatii]|uniref:Membrane integrity-associated transporter subunit PqiC n=1 Tax=Pseudomonas lalucatii TaxID=1424203 RepID=A0ABS5Q0X5_9PSED|nr:ABC-type transport auxiliary lipoprotein family protein [Pseudomonas lalucatii]MBS7662430.1 membrane integrity-associated transporter subunit PqiC [Pseudomonas lalucatii]MBS7725918.1 membrane integrity-associated transporter subunit PqiC [Pseudomonas lalucatii]QVM88491.1 membrane integrity-associated transporter subunit PqiC [Pseudomonas lalucatii]
MSRLACALLLAGLLGACSLLPESEPLTLYRLPASALPSQAQGSAGVAWGLRVNTPHGGALLDSPRIAVLADGDRVSAYHGARWVDRATLLLRDRLLDGFRDDGRIALLSSDTNRLRAELQLDGDLRAFHGEYQEGRGEAHILLEARLVDSRSRRILASRRFQVRQGASDSSVAALVSAFGRAADRLSLELVQWTLAQGRAATGPGSSAGDGAAN